MSLEINISEAEMNAMIAAGANPREVIESAIHDQHRAAGLKHGPVSLSLGSHRCPGPAPCRQARYPAAA